VLLPEKLFVQEKETPLRKQEKQLPERESVQLQQEKVLEEQPQGDLLEGEDARTSSFFITFDTNCRWVQNKTKKRTWSL